MKPKRIWSIGIVLMSVWFIGISQSSIAGSYQSYVKDPYYLGVGGTPPTLDEFAVNPRAYLRSEAAYLSLKNGFAELLGRSLSDEAFSRLLASDQVRAERYCVGYINTAGITPAGGVKWSVRGCYLGEKLIELKVHNQWQVVASQGCFNLVKPKDAVTQAKPKIEVISAPPPLRSPEVIVRETRGIFVHSCNCPRNHACHDDIYLPGYQSFIIH